MKFGFDWPSGPLDQRHPGQRTVRCLKSVDDGGMEGWMDGRRMDDGACLYYNLTYEPKGSGELKNKRPVGHYTHHSSSVEEDNTNKDGQRTTDYPISLTFDIYKSSFS